MLDDDDVAPPPAPKSNSEWNNYVNLENGGQ